MKAFVGVVVGFNVRGEYTTLTVESPADQLGRAINLIEFTGAGSRPRPIALKVMGRDNPDPLSIRAWLKQFRVDRDGDFVVTFTVQDTFDIERLRTLLDRGVALGYDAIKEEGQDNTITPDAGEEDEQG